ncbi:uncharacterized protein BT62DRAFT_926978 [Guyanagaster necrorhizus]|uniref:F-box domain-containing protein n=1 Tax=Guyanagaster necrorhizus TaxID=856835 RepID=A0A9P7W238_9AGAR|nr:uncharacterized protein BT62DRAFT_926978 [Guyanagaster necrorhizus MCA 3950]KAG7451303.1 hypothetical protein BT62DRAFT_926978 [Guyanagaster necrorhizus MCA 3950]
MTPEQAEDIRQLLHNEEHVLASLNAEIKEATALLEKITRDRDALQEIIVGKSGPHMAALRAGIEEKEKELRRVQKESKAVKASWDRMCRERGMVAESDPDLLKHLDFELELCRQTVQRLQNEEDSVQVSLDSQRSALSPIRRLPLEILSEIFKLCLPGSYIIPKSRSAPLLLTQVCGSWRRLALSIPQLWSSISVEVTVQRCRPPLPLIELWLQRSMTQPLSFAITELEQEDAREIADPVTAASILKTFVPAHHRWASVKLEYHDWRWPSGLEQLPQDALLDSLEKLDLQREYWFKDDFPDLKRILQASRLHDLTWHSRSPPSDYLQIVNILQLTHLDLVRPVSKDVFLDVLSGCRAIESCTFFVQLVGRIPDDSNHPLDTSPIVLPHLHTFELTVDMALTTLLSRLVFSSLTTLQINRLDEFFLINPINAPHFWDQEEVNAFLVRSQCSLRTLDVRDVEISSAELLDVLKFTSPTLQQLNITNERAKDNCITDDVVRALTASSSSSDPAFLCPQLDYLKLWRCVSSTDGLLADMVQSRWLPREEDTAKRMRLVIILLRDEECHATDVARLKEFHRRRPGITLVRR